MSTTLETLREKVRFLRPATLLFAYWRRDRSAACCVCGTHDVVTLNAHCDLSGDYSPTLTTGAGGELRVSFCDDCLRDALKESGRV